MPDAPASRFQRSSASSAASPASEAQSDNREQIAANRKRQNRSVPANIAEGSGRWNAPDLARFAWIASGSLRELETHVRIAQRLGYVSGPTANQILQETAEVARMLLRIRSRVLANISATEAKPGLNGQRLNQLK